MEENTVVTNEQWVELPEPPADPIGEGIVVPAPPVDEKGAQ